MMNFKEYNVGPRISGKTGISKSVNFAQNNLSIDYDSKPLSKISNVHSGPGSLFENFEIDKS